MSKRRNATNKAAARLGLNRYKLGVNKHKASSMEEIIKNIQKNYKKEDINGSTCS